MPRASLVLAISTAQKIFAISLSMDKNSCLNFARLSAWWVRLRRKRKKRTLIQGVLINGMCLFEVRAARRREYERRAFVAHKLLLLQPQQVVVVRLGSLCSSSHTAKNFAFIFDIQAPVRLFLLSGSPCVRSTSDCAMLMATPSAQSAVA